MRVEACFQLWKSPQPPPPEKQRKKESRYMRKSRPKREFQILLEKFRPAELENSEEKFSIRLLKNLHLVKILRVVLFLRVFKFIFSSFWWKVENFVEGKIGKFSWHVRKGVRLRLSQQESPALENQQFYDPQRNALNFNNFLSTHQCFIVLTFFNTSSLYYDLKIAT